MDRKQCPDGGACHHECVTSCWRVEIAGPLTGVFPDNRWPDGAGSFLPVASGVPETAHTDYERETLASRWLVNYHGSIDATALTLAFKAGFAAGLHRTVQGEPSDAQLLAQGFTNGVDFIDNHPGPWGAGMVAGRAEAARLRAAAETRGER